MCWCKATSLLAELGLSSVLQAPRHRLPQGVTVPTTQALQPTEARPPDSRCQPCAAPLAEASFDISMGLHWALKLGCPPYAAMMLLLAISTLLCSLCADDQA